MRHVEKHRQNFPKYSSNQLFIKDFSPCSQINGPIPGPRATTYRECYELNRLERRKASSVKQRLFVRTELGETLGSSQSGVMGG